MKKLQRIIAALVLAVLGVMLMRRTSLPTAPPREEIWTVMGTVASLKTPASARPHFTNMQAIAKQTFNQVNAALSVYDPTSELSQLNQTGILMQPSALTRDFLHATTTMTSRTAGRFDPTLLPVIQRWGFSGGAKPDTLPSPEEIAIALDRGLLANLISEPGKVWYTNRPAVMDAGGIAKGFAIDRAFEQIHATFPTSPFLLNLGGEIRVQGQAEPGRAWRIGVQHPFEKGKTLGVVTIPSGYAIATSGHYERYFEHNGVRYAHIIDPATGWPVTGMAGVTVLCPNATEADVLSTALFVAGIENAAQQLAAFPESHALLIPDRHPIEIYLSPGMLKHFEPAPAYRDITKKLPQPTPEKSPDT